MSYIATKQHVANRGIPPDGFLDQLVAWGKQAPDEIFAPNPHNDVYSSVFNTLGPTSTTCTKHNEGMASQSPARLTEQDYLALERVAEFKSEFVNGNMYARSPVTSRHSILTVHLSVVLMNQLQARKYFVYNSDLRVRAAKSQSYLYPDLSVASSEAISPDEDILETPTVIVEVLSPSTADYDHGKKFSIYREIPSLKDYLLVHTQEIMIEHFTPQANGSWLLAYHKGLDAVVELKSIGCSIALKDIYSGVFPENTDIQAKS